MKHLCRSTFALAISALVLTAAPSVRAERDGTPRDPAPPPQPARPAQPAPCEDFIGGVSGNDPSQRVTLHLCGAGTHVTGTIGMEGDRGGWSLRAVEGDWTADRSQLVMHDTRIVRGQANVNWRFCTVDRYVLTATSPGHWTGRYDSAACDDHATMHIERAVSR